MMNAMEIGHNMKKSEQIKKLTKENEGKLSEVSLHLVNSLAQGMERIEKGNITFMVNRRKIIIECFFCSNLCNDFTEKFVYVF